MKCRRCNVEMITTYTSEIIKVGTTIISDKHNTQQTCYQCSDTYTDGIYQGNLSNSNIDTLIEQNERAIT